MNSHTVRSLCVVLVASGISSACRSGSSKAASGEPPTPVRLAAVERAPYVALVRSSGRLAAKKEMKLAFKVGGVIQAIRVDEGQRVRRGQLLAKLDLAEIKARAQMAKSSLDKAERDHERANELYADQVATREDTQNAQTAVDVAAANLEIARFNLRHASVRAPADGVILRRLAEVGELIAPGHPVLTFGAHTDDWVVRVSVTDRDVVRLSLGDRARVSLDAYPGEPFAGRVSEIAAASDPLSSMFEVEVRLEKSDNRLFSGLLAGVQIEPQTHQEKAIIPFAALTEAHGRTAYVFIPDQNRTSSRRVPVEIADFVGDTAVIDKGLEEVDTVITDGSAYLADAGSIRVVDSSDASSSQP